RTPGGSISYVGERRRPSSRLALFAPEAQPFVSPRPSSPGMTPFIAAVWHAGLAALGRFLEGRIGREDSDLSRRLAATRDQERGQCPDGYQRRAHVDGGVQAVRERLGRAVATVVREDRGQDRDAEDAAELADRVIGSRRLTLLVPPDG